MMILSNDVAPIVVTEKSNKVYAYLKSRIQRDSTPINTERVKKLMEFGFTEYQSRVYLALLDLGTASASQIPPLSRVPRTRIYATMQQLHDKGLVEIVPETPLRYTAVPFTKFVRKISEEYRQKASELEKKIESLSNEFAITGGPEPEDKGRFEAIYGRKNARERLTKMYSTANKEIIGIGTRRSPGRILKALGSILEEKAKVGVILKYAFPFKKEDMSDFKELTRFANVRRIEFDMPVYMHVVDQREFFMSHPIPDDESFYLGDDICIWTNDPAITKAMNEMALQIWQGGNEIMEKDR